MIKTAAQEDAALQYFLSHLFWIGKANKDIKNLFQKIINENSDRNKWSDSVITALTINLIVEMVKLYDPKRFDFSPEKGFDMNERRSLLLDKLFFNNNLNSSIEVFANSLGVSPHQLQRIIKDAYGSTFKKLRNEARMSKAAVLLEEGSLNIQECSVQCGYSSAASFDKAFKDKYGVSPKEFQNKQTK